MRLHCKEHGYMDEKTGPTAECPYCRIEELETELAISKQLNTSKGLRAFLDNEDRKNRLRKLRNDQHVKSYKLERDYLRQTIANLKSKIGDLMVQYEIPASDELKELVG